MFKRTNCFILSTKAKVILDLIKGGISVAKICEKYNILPEQVLQWKQEALRALIACFLSTAKVCPTVDDHSIEMFYELTAHASIIKNMSKQEV